VWVPGRRQFKDFDEYLLPRDDFNRRQLQGHLGLPVPTSAQASLDDRLALLREELDVTNKLAAAGELPDVEITERGLIRRSSRRRRRAVLLPTFRPCTSPNSAAKTSRTSTQSRLAITETNGLERIIREYRPRFDER
jgi:hypothetical protein